MNTRGAKRVKVPVESKGRRNRAPKVEGISHTRLLMRANTQLKVGDPASAARTAQHILSQDQSHLGALETLAKSLWRQGSFEEVLATLDKAIALNPYEPGYHAMKASAYQSMGRYGEAISEFQRASDLPGTEEALRELQVWQAGLVADLLKIDTVFRAAYAQDPAKACEAKGFKFVEGPAQDTWYPAQSDRAWTYTRPS